MFRYRILFYHENQPWVSQIAPLLDVPVFQLLQTDSETVAYRQIEAGEVDIILAGSSTKHFMLREDASNSMSYKRVILWEIIENHHQLRRKLILLCTQNEVDMGADLVEKGKIADYVLIDPMVDKQRLYYAILKDLETSLLWDIVMERFLGQEEELPPALLERIELLQTIRKTAPPAHDIPAEQSKELGSWVVETDPASDLGSWAPAESLEAEPQSDEAIAEEPDMMFSAFPSLTEGNSLIEEANVPALESGSVFASLKEAMPGGNPDTRGRLWAAHREKREKKQVESRVSRIWSKMKKSEYEILLLNNDPDSTASIQNILRETGYKILVAYTAREGLDFLSNEIFDLLLIDRNLPDQNGFDFLNKLRYKGPQHDIPAILITDQADEDHVIKTIKVGANYLVVKPLNPQYLIEHVKELMKTPR